MTNIGILTKIIFEYELEREVIVKKFILKIKYTK